MADASTSVTKTKAKKKKIKAFHQKKKLFRAQDPKISILMWGICHSVSPIFVSLCDQANEILFLVDSYFSEKFCAIFVGLRIDFYLSL